MLLVLVVGMWAAVMKGVYKRWARVALLVW
jgi:hypothetical protein